MKRRRPSVNGFCEKFEWNTDDKSSEVCIGGTDNNVALFHPYWSNGTAGVRGNKPVNRQRAKVYWEVSVKNRVFGTSMMFGLTTRHARLHCDTFVNLIGENEYGWGLSHKGLIWHKGEWKIFTKPFQENSSTVIGCLYDGLQGTLSYYKDGICLGVAFHNLHLVEHDLYPTIASTAAKTEFMLTYAQREFCNLQERCRFVIRQSLSDRKIDSLNGMVPQRLISFLKMQNDETIRPSTRERFEQQELEPSFKVTFIQRSRSQSQRHQISNINHSGDESNPIITISFSGGFQRDRIPMPDL